MQALTGGFLILFLSVLVGSLFSGRGGRETKCTDRSGSLLPSLTWTLVIDTCTTYLSDFISNVAAFVP